MSLPVFVGRGISAVSASIRYRAHRLGSAVCSHLSFTQPLTAKPLRQVFRRANWLGSTELYIVRVL